MVTTAAHATTAQTSILSPLDSAFLYFERPNQLLHVGCLACLDGPVGYQDLVRLSGERLGPLERYRQRPVRPMLDLGAPRWEADPDFDLRRHIRHVGVPAPGGPAELHELADALFATPLDPLHPLWETVLIDGLAGGRSAVLMKVHHCMIDGISGAQVLERMTDAASPPTTLSAPTHGAAEPAARGSSRPPSPEGRLAAFAQSLREVASPAGLLSQARAASEVLQTIAALVREPATPLPFNGPLSDRRQVVWASFALDEFLAMRGVAGCKVNDVVLAVIADAIHRYLEGIGYPTADLSVRAVVPVSVRRSEDHLTLGNLVVSMLPKLPIGVEDPAATVRIIAEEMRGLKDRGQARATGFALGLASALPAPLGALLGRLLPDSAFANTVCTNVPGPRETRTLLGRRVVEICPYVPLFQGMGLEFAVLSYGDRLTIGATCDPHLVPEPERIAKALTDAHAGLHEALGVAASGRRPKSAAAGPRVSDLMTRTVVAARPWDSLAAALGTMRRGRFRHLPIVAEDGRLVGILTHRDLLAAEPSSLGVASTEQRESFLAPFACAEAMETHLSTTSPDEPAPDAARRMIEHKIGCLPVLASDGRLVGILTEEDFLRWSADQMGAPTAAPIAERPRLCSHPLGLPPS